MAKKTYFRGTLRLVIDTDDAATPAMVYSNGGKFSSTYDCAVDNACVDDAYELDSYELAWLEGYRDQVDAAYTTARHDHPDYQ